MQVNAGLIFMRLFLIRMGWPSFISLHDALQQTDMSLLDICSVRFNSVALYFRVLDPVFRVFMQKDSQPYCLLLCKTKTVMHHQRSAPRHEMYIRTVKGLRAF